MKLSDIRELNPYDISLFRTAKINVQTVEDLYERIRNHDVRMSFAKTTGINYGTLCRYLFAIKNAMKGPWFRNDT